MIWPLRPMSAVWMRAQELGQPLTLSRIGASSEPSSTRSASRVSSSAMASVAVCLVSTIASLQYSMPVQAIVVRRNGLGRPVVVVAVLLQVHPDVVAGAGGRRGRRAVRQRVAEVLRLEHLAELRGPPL